jgi:hypothetical protein
MREPAVLDLISNMLVVLAGCPSKGSSTWIQSTFAFTDCPPHTLASLNSSSFLVSSGTSFAALMISIHAACASSVTPNLLCARFVQWQSTCLREQLQVRANKDHSQIAEVKHLQ